MRLVHLSAAAAFAAGVLSAQNAITRQPIVDMHVHAAMSMSAQPACANTPAFLASDPAQKEDRFGWKPVACADPLLLAKTQQSYEKELKRLQYEGMLPSDPAVEEYFALAEKLDVVVGIHMWEIHC